MASQNGKHRRSAHDPGIDLRAPRLTDYDGRYGDPTPAADSESETSVEMAALRSDDVGATEARELLGNARSGI